MKLMTAEQLIELLPPDPAVRQVAERRFQKIISAHGSPSNWLDYSVNEGILKVEQVNSRNVPAFVVWYQATPEGRLFVDSAQAVTREPMLDVLIRGMELLAERENCKAIEFRTLRRGLVRRTVTFGFKPTAIILTKFL